MGDLNYRITLPATQTKSLINQSNFNVLLQHDQLRFQLDSKKNCNKNTYSNFFFLLGIGFKEAPITFPPTYKFDIGTSIYDTSEKNRVPSYCDRILYYPNPLHADWLSCTEYASCGEMVLSDHKPVVGRFVAKTRMVDQNALNGIRGGILRDLDRFENEAIPDLAVVFCDDGWGMVEYGVGVTRVVEVVNKGRVVAEFKFGDDDDWCPEWVLVEPRSGCLLAGKLLMIKL